MVLQYFAVSSAMHSPRFQWSDSILFDFGYLEPIYFGTDDLKRDSILTLFVHFDSADNNGCFRNLRFIYVSAFLCRFRGGANFNVLLWAFNTTPNPPSNTALNLAWLVVIDYIWVEVPAWSFYDWIIFERLLYRPETDYANYWDISLGHLGHKVTRKSMRNFY